MDFPSNPPWSYLIDDCGRFIILKETPRQRRLRRPLKQLDEVDLRRPKGRCAFAAVAVVRRWDAVTLHRLRQRRRQDEEEIEMSIDLSPGRWVGPTETDVASLDSLIQRQLCYLLLPQLRVRTEALAAFERS